MLIELRDWNGIPGYYDLSRICAIIRNEHKFSVIFDFGVSLTITAKQRDDLLNLIKELSESPFEKAEKCSSE